MLEKKDRIGGKTTATADPLLKASTLTNIGRKRAVGNGETRNRRTVWSVALQPLRDEHFAAFPEKLVEPCIRAGSRPGDTVLDPFAGSGTTLRVCERLGRAGIGIELNPAYIALQERRTDGVQVEMELSVPTELVIPVFPEETLPSGRPRSAPATHNDKTLVPGSLAAGEPRYE